MKYFLFTLLLFASQQFKAQSTLLGKINNLSNSSDVDFKIVFIRNNARIDSTFSKMAGFYEKKIPTGNYDIELSKSNYKPVLLRAIYINTGNISINFSVHFNQLNTPKLIANTPAVPAYPPAGDTIFSVKSLADTPAGTFTLPGSLSPSASHAPPVTYKWEFGDGADHDGSPGISSESGKTHSYTAASGTTSKITKGGKYSSSMARGKKPAATKSHELIEKRKDESPVEPDDVPAEAPTAPKAGQVTAGHWRDLDNWNQWLLTNQKAEIAPLQKTWGFYPKKLLKLTFEDRNGNALSYTNVTLLDEHDKFIWQTKTDQDGKAYFWPSLFGRPTAANQISPAAATNYKVRIGQKGTEQTINNVNTFIQSGNKIKTELEKTNDRKLEIGFVVDATGSMGDEINFLQVELMDVINRVQKKNPCLSLHTGSVFYKDESDDYVTRVLPLSDNPANTIQFIGEQAANGGGDFPEAIDMALKDAIEQLNWSEGNHPKIMFLLLDAPPHQDSGSLQRMRNYTRIAAEKGIRIVPIAASGIDKATEFLLKYMAIATNGEYLYITDDSKIGDSHLKPTGGESKAEFLNDLMVKVINHYSEGSWCKQQQEEIAIQNRDSSKVTDSLTQANEKNTEIIAGNDWYMRFFPNPAAANLQIQFSEEVERISITDVTGQTIFVKDNQQGTSLSLDISNWSTGIYMVHALRKNETVSGKLLVMH